LAGVDGQLKVGTVWLNEHLMIFCEAPWGGCKESGYGKDLSTMVLDEYVHTKHIYIDVTGAPVRLWYMILKQTTGRLTDPIARDTR
jgi:hypothetical protein